jgi:hypothetical protein
MIFDRQYDPGDGELIYHYCRPEAFVEIVTSQAMWHTAHYVLNDSMEREWGYSIFTKAAKRLPQQVDSSFAERIDTIIKMAYLHSSPMISCYSLDADVLSQWRAYADNGRGFVIGFSPKLMQMPAKKLRVLYDEESQIQELLGNLNHTLEYERSIGFKFDDQFQTHWANVGLDLCSYKNPSFREEKEIRLVRLSALTPERGIISLGALDQDGKRLADPVDINFRIRDGLVVPFVALDYTNQGRNSPVREIILGPKNENEESNIELFLKTVGLKDVTIRRSQSSFR